MRFFGNVGEQALRTAPDGQRLFYSFGPWSRPYVVPDAETEHRLSEKQRWLIGILMGLVVVGQWIVLAIEPARFSTVGLLGYVAFVLLGYAVVQQVLFRSELRSLTRAESRLSFHDYYADVAARRTVGNILLQVGLALGFAALGVWMIVGQSQPVLGWMLIVVFTPMSAVWLYALGLKLRNRVL